MVSGRHRSTVSRSPVRQPPTMRSTPVARPSTGWRPVPPKTAGPWWSAGPKIREPPTLCRPGSMWARGSMRMVAGPTFQRAGHCSPAGGATSACTASTGSAVRCRSRRSRRRRRACGTPTCDLCRPGRSWCVYGNAIRGEGVVNELVAVPAEASADPWVVASGHDFYAAPRPSPDGRRLAWLTWDRPCMPWDGADLWVADLGPDGRLGAASHVAGGPQESVVQPEWDAEGVLHFVSDRSGWWNLYRERHGQVEPLLPMAAEFADAPWEFDYSSYAFVGDGRIACRYRQHGRDRLTLLDPETGRLTDLSIPYTSLKPYLRAVGDRLAFIGASPTASSAVAILQVPTGHLDVLAGAEVSLDAAWVSVPKPIQFPSRDGQTAHALYYPPTNPEVTGPADARPPLLVQAHPGPTADAKARLDLRIQFFTSRGFAVVEVNYAGSTGYGRGYRERLTGLWGLLAVADCLGAARSLIQRGEVDGGRLVISGESAGGFTALCALASEDRLAVGASRFGIADLESFRQQASRFQAHELDRLVGPYPEAAATYRARSPLHAVDRIARPVLLVHGLEDTVVPPSQAQVMAEALARRGIRHVLLAIPGEGHGFRRPDSIRRALEVELSFYVEALGLMSGMPDVPLATDDAIAAGSSDQRLGR